VARGIDYEVWAAHHSDAIRLLEHRPLLKATPKRPAPGRSAASTTTRERVAARNAEPSGDDLSIVSLFLVVGSLGIVVSALMPTRFAPVVVQRIYQEPERRMIALAMAIASLVGILIALYVG
jgi:hypothetical protein